MLQLYGWMCILKKNRFEIVVSRILLKPQLLKLADHNFLRREKKIYMSDVDIICVYDKKQTYCFMTMNFKFNNIYLEIRYKT